MRKIPFDPKERAELIEKALQKGILLNTNAYVLEPDPPVRGLE